MVQGYHHRRGRDFAGHLRRRARSRIRHLPAGDGGARPPARRALRRHLSPPARRSAPAGRSSASCAAAALILVLFRPARKTLATCLFIGLILGTLPEPVGTRRARRGAARGAYLSLRGQLPCPLRRFALRVKYGAFYTRCAAGFLRLSLLRPALGPEPDRTGHDVLLHPDGGRAVHADGRGLRKARHGGDPAVAARHGAHRADARARGESGASRRTTRFSTTPCSASCWPRRSLSSRCITTARATCFCACLPPRSARSRPTSARSYSRRRMHKNIKSRQEPYGSCRLPCYPLFLLRYSRAKRRSSSS